jgi:hypothetical protein
MQEQSSVPVNLSFPTAGMSGIPPAIMTTGAFALADKFLSQSISLDPPVFYVWGHSYEFDMKQNWSVLEQLLERVSGKEEVWYASNIEIHDYTEAFRGLIWSGDCSKVHTPAP